MGIEGDACLVGGEGTREGFVEKGAGDPENRRMNRSRVVVEGSRGSKQMATVWEGQQLGHSKGRRKPTGAGIDQAEPKHEAGWAAGQKPDAAGSYGEWQGARAFFRGH